MDFFLFKIKKKQYMASDFRDALVILIAVGLAVAIMILLIIFEVLPPTTGPRGKNGEDGAPGPDFGHFLVAQFPFDGISGTILETSIFPMGLTPPVPALVSVIADGVVEAITVTISELSAGTVRFLVFHLRGNVVTPTGLQITMAPPVGPSGTSRQVTLFPPFPFIAGDRLEVRMETNNVNPDVSGSVGLWVVWTSI